MFISIAPVGKPRMTNRDRWAKRPAVLRYHQFCDELRRQFIRPLPAELVIEFHMPMPASWSKKKRTAHLGQPHQQRPDIDNLCKAVMDALAVDDSYIHILHARKFWVDEADSGIEIEMGLPSIP